MYCIYPTFIYPKKLGYCDYNIIVTVCCKINEEGQGIFWGVKKVEAPSKYPERNGP